MAEYLHPAEAAASGVPPAPPVEPSAETPKSEFMQRTRNPFVRLFMPNDFEGTSAYQRRQLEIAQHRMNVRKAELEYQGKIRDLLTDALNIDVTSGDEETIQFNKNLKNATLNSIFKSVEQQVGKKVSPLAQSILKGDTKLAKAVLDAAAEQGMTMSDLFALTGDPLATAEAMTAFHRQRRERAGREAAAGDTTPAPAAPAAPVAPVAPEGGAPNPLQGRVAAIDAQIATIKNQRGAAIKNIDNPAVLSAITKGYDEALARLEGEKEKITTGRSLEIERENRQPISEQAAQDLRDVLAARGHGNLVNAVSAGMPKSQADAVRATSDRLNARQTPQPAPGPGRAVPPGPAAPVPPLQPGPPTPQPQPLTSQQKLEARLAAETDAAKRRKIAEEFIGASYKDLAEINAAGTAAQNALDTIAPVAGAAEKVGATGPWVTPIRNVLNNTANVFGVANPAGQSNLQLISAFNARLAVTMTQMMKGQQSDKELALALASNAGGNNTEKGLAVMLYVTQEMAKKALEHSIQARAWAARYGTIDSTDDKGRTFTDMWNATMQDYQKRNGTLAERTAKAFNVDNKKLLKGIVAGS